MAKIDITTSRTLTISVGNYESIKPSVSLTLKEVEASKASDAYVTLSNILDGLMKIEIMESSKEFGNIKKSGGMTNYVKTVSDNMEVIGKSVEDHMNNLYKYL